MPRNTHFPIKTLSLLSLSALLASSVMADPAPQEQAHDSWSWSAHVGTMNIDSKTAKEQGVGDSAWAIGLAAEHYIGKSFLTVALGVDFIGYDDNYSFSQKTNKGNKKSDASAALMYIELGPRITFGKDNSNYFIAHAGASKMLSSDRGIGYCTDCYSENIDVNGGLYGALSIGRTFDHFDLGLQFQQYFSGDLDNSLRLRISSSF